MAFHPYPRVIPPVFNPGGFGPPRGLTPASACPRIAHPASRPRRATERPVQTRFRSGSLRGLASPRTATRWLILQKARRHSRRGLLRLLGGARFQVLFHSPLGVLFTFPSRYLFAIGRRRVFSLGGWSPRLRTGFLVPGPTREGGRAVRSASPTGLSPCAAGLPRPFGCAPVCHLARGSGPPDVSPRNTGTPAPPGCAGRAGLGIARFRSPLLPGSRLISLPPGT